MLDCFKRLVRSLAKPGQTHPTEDLVVGENFGQNCELSVVTTSRPSRLKNIYKGPDCQATEPQVVKRRISINYSNVRQVTNARLGTCQTGWLFCVIIIWIYHTFTGQLCLGWAAQRTMGPKKWSFTKFKGNHLRLVRPVHAVTTTPDPEKKQKNSFSQLDQVFLNLQRKPES